MRLQYIICIHITMIAVVLLILIVLLIFFVLAHNKQQASSKEFPSPPANFLFGHVPDVISTRVIIPKLSQWTEEHGKIFRVRFGPVFAPIKTMIITTDYKLAEFVLSSNKILKKGENYEFFKPWLGDGLISSESKIWKKHRKILTPAFHFEILKEFVSVFESVGDVMIEKLSEKADSSSLDLHPFVTLCALDIICETAMGTKIHAQEGENVEYVESVKELLNIVLGRFTSPLKIFDWSFMLTRDYYVQKKMLKIAHKFSSDLITKAINNKKANGNMQKGKKLAFLDLLLKYSQDGNLLSQDEIRAEVDTFMFAGHDTTSAGICYILYCLADHSEIQEKVLQEQKHLFGDEKNPEISHRELQNMKYLELVIKESLRYYPVIPGLTRYAEEDFEFDGHIIPKHTNIGIFIYGMMRNPEFFPEPDRFNPDRFKNFNNSPPFAYIPFSAGPRNCIGQKYAMLEMKSVVSKVIRHFELIPAIPKHHFEFAFEVTLKSLTGIKVGLKKRI